MSDIKIKDLLRLFPQVICGVENLNVISNGRVDLSELAVESGMTEIVENNSQVYRDFIKKNEKYRKTLAIIRKSCYNSYRLGSNSNLR